MSGNPTRAVIPPFEHAGTSTRETGPIHAVKRGVPDFAPTQRDTILRLLKEAKRRDEGVSCEYLIFTLHFTVCRTRIFELEEIGYEIRHEKRPGQRYVTYFLEKEPVQEKPLPSYETKKPDKRQGAFSDSSDWYVSQTKRERPGEPTPDLGPLFGTVRP